MLPPNLTPEALYLIVYTFISYYICNKKKLTKASGTLQHLQYGYLSINTCRTWLISVNIQEIQLFPRKNIGVNKDVNHKSNSCSFKGAHI